VEEVVWLGRQREKLDAQGLGTLDVIDVDLEMLHSIHPTPPRSRRSEGV
jgi:hypothetical protein